MKKSNGTVQDHVTCRNCCFKIRFISIKISANGVPICPHCGGDPYEPVSDSGEMGSQVQIGASS